MTARRSGRAAWAVAWAGAVALQLMASIVPGADTPIGSPLVLFWLVVIAAGGCVVASSLLLWRAVRDDTAELGLVAAFAFAVSALPLVHGLTTPGVLYGANAATLTSVLWALPLALVAVSPLLLPRRRLARWSPHWRAWVGGNVVVQIALSIGLLVAPDLLPVVGMGDPVAIAAAGASLIGTVVLSARHLRLYRIARTRGPLVVAIALAFIAAGNLVWVNGAPM